MKKTLLLVMIVLIVAWGCTAPAPSTGKVDGLSLGKESNLKKFQSSSEIKAYLDAHQRNTNLYFGGMVKRGGDVMMAVAESAPSASPMADSDGASDYSQTNVQVEGVDEADFIKNDGKYIYTLTDNVLVIVDAFPPQDAKVLSKTVIDGYPSTLFLNGDKVVVFTVVDAESTMIPEYEIIPQPRYAQVTKVLIYNVEDREEPELQNEIELNGYYRDSRMIGDNIYVIAQDQVHYYDGFLPMPMVKSGTRMIRPDVYYFDNDEESYVFNTVAGISLESGEVNAETFMLGWSNTLYSSEDNLYITYQKSLPYKDYRQERFDTAVKPILPNDVLNQVENTDKWDEIAQILEEMYSKMSKEEKEAFVKRAQEALESFDRMLDQEQSKTMIQKIGLDDGKISAKERGEVPGTLLNQFSLDEFDGNLRVATTTNLWRTGEIYNNVYVLDESMNAIGSLENLAKGEQIYSARFMGERLYLVTFKRVDPLFVISLEDPSDPKVLGELKIPGYSDYLHPIDENHLIGIGKETKENEWGGISTQGVKVAVFDVSDVENPDQVDTIELGKAGSESPALHDHKAFLYDNKRGILVLPVREIISEQTYDFKRGYQQNIWQGAYVLNVDANGIEVKGKVSQYQGNEQPEYYWFSPYEIRRSLYMDDTLYTISSRKIQANSLDTLEKINEVALPYRVDNPTPVLY